MKLAIRRVLEGEAGKVNALLADESIRPFALLGAGDDVDATGFVKDLANIAILCEDEEGEAQGALLFHFQEPGVYEVHTMARVLARGRPYLRAVQDALRTMFLCSGCMELYTRVPEGNDAALGLVRLIGGRHEYDLPAGFANARCGYWALRWPDWLWGAGGVDLVERGMEFHERLEAQFAEQGRAHTAHADTPAHDRMVGATSELILNGVVAKALVLYNRWAKVAGFAALSVVVADPLVLNIGDALVQVDFAKRDFYLLEASPSDLALPQERAA
jgi:hypothetical protein